MARHGVHVLTKQRTDSVPGAPAATARAHNTRPTCVAHIKALFVVMTSHFRRSLRNLWSIRLTSSGEFEMSARRRITLSDKGLIKRSAFMILLLIMILIRIEASSGRRQAVACQLQIGRRSARPTITSGDNDRITIK